MIKLLFSHLYRRLVKDKFYAFIAICSLSLGLTCFLILYAYLDTELSYDQYHEKHDRIYRLISVFGDRASAPSAEGIGPLLVENYPGLEEYVRFRPTSPNTLVQFQENSIFLSDSFYADSNIFNVFTHKSVFGDSQTALDDPYSIAIDREVAEILFGGNNPIGETIEYGGTPLTVKFVYEKVPENSHIKHKALLPYSLRLLSQPGIEENYIRDLNRTRTFTYLLVSETFQLDIFPSISGEFYSTYMGGDLSSQPFFHAELQPLASIHYGRELSSDLETGDIFYIYSFGWIAALLVFVGCINYMILATARATKRASEIGLSRILGANRFHLLGGFLMEAAIFVGIAAFLSILLTQIALELTPVGIWMGKDELEFQVGSQSNLVMLIVVATALISLSGTYPALYLFSIPISIAMGKRFKSWAAMLRSQQILILIQLGIAIGIIASTGIMVAQMNYVHGKPLGFEYKNRILVPLQSTAMSSFPALKAELLRHPGIISVTNGNIPGMGGGSNTREMETNDGATRPQRAANIVVDPSYIVDFGIEVTEGRSFATDRGSDLLSTIIVNEELVRQMSWDEPIGKKIVDANGVTREVIGVTADHHFDSLRNVIEPLVIRPRNTNFDTLLEPLRSQVRMPMIVEFVDGSVDETLNHIQESIRRLDSNQLIEPSLLSEEIERIYETEENLMNLTGSFATVCILLSALGLTGLVAYSGERRRKEIGIRKVFGASPVQIAVMFAWNFGILSVIAAIPSSFISFYAMDNWLENFAYRMDFSVTPYLVAASFVLLVVLLTTVLQSLSFTRMNPIEVLRYD